MGVFKGQGYILSHMRFGRDLIESICVAKSQVHGLAFQAKSLDLQVDRPGYSKTRSYTRLERNERQRKSNFISRYRYKYSSPDTSRQIQMYTFQTYKSLALETQCHSCSLRLNSSRSVNSGSSSSLISQTTSSPKGLRLLLQ